MRYDAKIKHYPELSVFIHTHFEVISICPEIEIGLSVPRPAVQLTGTVNQLKITGRDDQHIDITEKMLHFCQHKILDLNDIHGYIFKSKSPSCGIKDIPIFSPQGTITSTTQGVFAHSVLQHFPNLPITDELTLENEKQRHHFLQHVIDHTTQC